MDNFSTLVFNAGNQSLNFSLMQGLSANPLKLMIEGSVCGIGNESSFNWTYGSIRAHISIEVPTYEEATELILDWLQNLWPFGSLLENISLVEYQFIYCSKQFCTPIIVTENVISQLENLPSLAMQHNSEMIGVMRTSRNVMTRKVVMIATFFASSPDNLFDSK